MKQASTIFKRGLHSTIKNQSYEFRPRIKIVEVSPRDGLQNEATVLDAATKANLIADLAKAGLSFIEAGSFVSPKVKQMSNTGKVLLSDSLRPILNNGRVTLSTLIPNVRGYQDYLHTLQALRNNGTDTSRMEIAIFASATEAFSKANLNASRVQALNQLAQVAEAATKQGIKVRGYVSCVVKVSHFGNSVFKSR